MDFSSNQKLVLKIGMVLIALTFLFPHYQASFKGEKTYEEKYDFILSSSQRVAGHDNRHYRYSIDYERLFTQIFVISLLTVLAVLALKQGEEESAESDTGEEGCVGNRQGKQTMEKLKKAGEDWLEQGEEGAWLKQGEDGAVGNAEYTDDDFKKQREDKEEWIKKREGKNKRRQKTIEKIKEAGKDWLKEM